MARRKPGSVLLAKRKEAGLTQCQVAERVRNMGHVTLSETHYRRIEQDVVTPSVILAIDVCYILDTDVYEIWG
jgi:DNA-binding XRE family transcriptional regulator